MATWQLDATLNQYLTTYNHHIPQRALNHQSPIQATKRCQIDKPDLFVKRVYKQAGLDTYRHLCCPDCTPAAAMISRRDAKPSSAP